MNVLKKFILPLAMIVSMSFGAAHADILAFDDAWSANGDTYVPTSYYPGVTISGDTIGVMGGVSNGDPGNWDLEGTNGPAFLGVNSGVGSATTFTLSSPVTSFSMDVGLANGWNNDFTLTAFLGATPVHSVSFTLTDANGGTGTWHTAAISGVGAFDSVTLTSTSGTGFAWGMDNVVFSSTPVAATPIPTLSQWGMILLSALLAIGTILALRRQRQ
ncbi:MAG: hypothetical protein QG662_1880 [Pseudomonadota bacterium]|nr:hypothetical protein [Pseudomonadota bacterium]